MNQRILVIRFGSLGDILLTSPTIINLKIAYPESHLTFLTKERFKLVVEMIDGVDKIETFPENGGVRELMSTITRLREEHYDIVIDFHRNLRSSLLFNSIPAKEKCFIDKRRRERVKIVKDNKLPIPPEDGEFIHTIDIYNQVLEKLGERVFCRRPLINVPANENAGEGFLETNDPIVMIAPGAAHLTKQYGLERFAQIAKLLQEKCSVKIVWAVTTSEHDKLAISDYLPVGSFLELVNAPIKQLAAIMKYTTLTISNDSGIGHLSSSCKVPTLVIFGPTHPAFGFSPRGLFDRVIQSEDYCRPCSLHGKKRCYREEQFCFNNITVEQVISEAVEMISQQIARKPALFIDRDGTLIKNKHYLSDPDEVELIEGSAVALKKAKEAGYKVVILSNQSGVARGMFSTDDVKRVNQRLFEMLTAQGVELDGSYYCPHHPETDNESEYKQICKCRKPSAGMAEQAANELNLDLSRSIVIGDSLVDINLGRILGANSYMVRTGHGRDTEEQLSKQSMWQNKEIVFDNLPTVIDYIL